MSAKKSYFPPKRFISRPPGSPYLPPQADPGASRRGGVATAPAGALVRPGYPPVTLPPSALRYVVPPSAYTGANGQVYVRQPQVKREMGKGFSGVIQFPKRTDAPPHPMSKMDKVLISKIQQ